jgi:predicted tellurium resistance membrane protein TerC
MRGSSKRDDRGNKKNSPTIITNAQDALSFEQRSRARRYFISMMVRTACFIATIFLPSPYRWIAMGGALVLPYVAVVLANAGRENSSEMNAIIYNEKKQITES